jgi:type I restriction enzyme, S subunit
MRKWPTKALEEICQINPRLPRDAKLPDNLEVSFLPMSGIDEVQANIKNIEMRLLKDVRKGYTFFSDNDVLFAKITPCMENGKAAIACNLKNGIGFGSTEFHVLRPGQDVLPEWIFSYIRQPVFREQAAKNFTGSAGQQRVPSDFLANSKIPLPPLSEQERIVKLLDEADELRKLREQADKRSAELIPALFEEMFGDPATNPKGWPIKNAGELMSACDYGTSQKANEEGRGICVLRMGNVTTDGRLDLTSLKTVELSTSELQRQLLQDGDVLFNRTNSRDLVGKTGMWDGRFEAVAASYFIRLRFQKEAEHPQHFTIFMNLPFMKKKLAEMARGAVGQANINSKELQSILVPVPPIQLQYEFAARVSDLRSLESSEAASRKNLDALFQSLLHWAFAGER